MNSTIRCMIALLAFFPRLHAATVIQNLTGPSESINPSGIISVNKFDPVLGTLTSVDLQVNVTTSSVGFSVYGSSSSSYASSSQTTQYNFTGPSGLSILGTINTVSFSFFNIGATTFGYTATAKNQSGSSSDSSGFSEWLGASGTVDLNYALQNFGSSSNGAGGGFNQVTPATDLGHPFGAASTFTGTLPYNYVAAAPEPSRVMLLLLTLGSLTVNRRRSRIG